MRQKRKATSILDEVERSAIPQGVTYLVHHGKALNEKRAIEEKNIGTEATLEMSLRLLGGTDKSESMDTLESEEDRDKTRKLAEVSEGKLARPSEDALFFLKRNNRRTQQIRRKNDEKMEMFLQNISDSVGAQLHGMNSSFVKMKEEGDDRYKQLSERFTKKEKKILDMDKKYESKIEEIKGQGKAVITGFHSETLEPEVIQLLKESFTEIGMTMENARIECSAKPTAHASIHFKNDEERNKFVRSANMLKKSYEEES